ncbi:sigma-54-dependent Fis family transcriptional regulator [Chitinibacter fontanus]|uniref:Sigma-54-dependent Fis family transcriptional regulator n=1 Tax=Chitinibacter fontanus TaxID=1737446 RepID=A0A7D5ZIS6_9NEIS|nr:sigma-54 dependent transcriptional regulator [Chitinibacter fontanus]QLI83008.1 sigma-54-dependent Fis family transcriptional regulator [Chitinibacter fontanus]
MSDRSSPILTYPEQEKSPLSIRAKALVFADPQSRALLAEVERIAPSLAPVLIHGETGTGKELVARHVHTISGRKGPFVAVNCGAISETLAESELFGHEAGAYTGAVGSKAGWFEAANGGTLFLDEIGDLPLALQVKLLRVLQEREVVRVGARKATAIDVRLVAATNVDLAQAVQAGHFRQDLYYRLNVVSFVLPPLRQRIGDIEPLADYFLEIYAQKLGFAAPRLTADSLAALQAYSWPGNIRELENIIHYALLVSSGREIHPEHLKLSAHNLSTPAATSQRAPLAEIAHQLKLLLGKDQPELFNTLEALLITTAYEQTRFNQVRTAELLGLTRNMVRTLLKRHGLLQESDSLAVHS